MKAGLKIGMVGKGGVGKTTLSALLARIFVGRGLRVVAVDTDSNPNLGLSLGLDLEVWQRKWTADGTRVALPGPGSIGHLDEADKKRLYEAINSFFK